jgi:hypothetical protein
MISDWDIIPPNQNTLAVSSMGQKRIDKKIMRLTFRLAGVPALCASVVFCQAQTSYGQTFTVCAQPASLTIYPGQQNVPVAITVGASTYAGPITVTLTGLPSGITVAPLMLSAGGTGTLNLSASLSAGQEGFPPTSPSLNTSWTAQAMLVASAGSTQALMPFPLTVSISNSAFAPAQSAINLPIVTINTNGVPIVDKTTDIPGTITITSPDGQTSYLPNSSDTDNTANFHLHGNSTIDMPKLPYHVALTTSLDLLNVMGLSCPYVTSGKAKPTCDKSKSYILLANYDDKTLLRDWAASALANVIPIGGAYLNSPADSPTPSGTAALMPWAPHSLFVELYLNGVYEGNYQLIEEVKVDSHRVNIDELAQTDVTDDITGGYLLEIDERQDEAFVFTTPHGVEIGLIDPDFSPDPEVPQQTTYISDYVDASETALFSSNFTDPTLGWRAYFDETSAINFYIVNDLMGNLDGGVFFSSDYLYKNIDNPLLYMGPIWDFDISAGNVNYATIVNPTVPWMQQEAVWYKQWFTDPGFKADVVKQWNTLKNNGVFSTWIASIPVQAKTLEQSQANNFARWPTLGMEVWPNSEAVGTYDGEVQQFTNWLQLRFSYLDTVFNSKPHTVTTLGAVAAMSRVGAPVTLTAEVTGGSSPTGQVSFLSSNVLVGTTPLTNGAATLITSNLQAGTDEIQAIYSGDQNNSLSVSADQGITVSPALDAVVVSVSGPATAYSGAASTFAAVVIPNAGTAALTGQVTFSVDGGAGTTMTLSASAAATFSTSSLAVGSHTITAVYSGDTNYESATGSISTVISVQPSFAVSGTQVTIAPGAISGNTSTITVTPSGGFTGTVALTATIASSPTGALNLPTLTFGSSNPVLISSATAGTATLTVSTTGSGHAFAQPLPFGTGWRGAGGVALACLLIVGVLPCRRVWRASVGMLFLLAFLVGGLVSCGGAGANSTTTAGSYTVTVTGTSGTTTSQSTITIEVQ